MTPHETNHIKLMSPAAAEPVAKQQQQEQAAAAVEQQIDTMIEPHDELKVMIENNRPFDSGFGFGSSAEDFDSPSDEFDNYELTPQFKQFTDELQKREESLKLDRQRNLLNTQLQHLKKNANVLVIGPENAGKTSLINSLAFMIRQKDGKNTWRTAADYDLGKRYKFKPVQLWPEKRQHQKIPRVTLYEASGFSKISEENKAATLLQYALEGRLEGRIHSLLQMFLLMNINDITERYREDPQDARVLADRKVDVIIHVAAADQEPDMALFELIRKAVMNSKDQAVKRIPILTVVTSPHDQTAESPVCDLAAYDLGAYVKKHQDAAATAGLRRNKSSSRLLGGNSASDSASVVTSLEPASVRPLTYYRPTYNPLTDETDSSNITPDQHIDQALLTLFEETLRLAGRKPTRPFGKAFFKAVKNHF
jgi:energy-coupling factor transporter ATP-binding protein EcfA2